MSGAIVKDKHLRLKQYKIDRAKQILEAKTESEAIEKALDLVIIEETIDRALKYSGGKGVIRKVFD